MHWTRKMNRARAGIFPTAVPADSLRSPREIPCRFCREFLCSQQGFHREISTCFRCRNSVENCLCWHSAGNLGLLPPSQKRVFEIKLVLKDRVCAPALAFLRQRDACEVPVRVITGGYDLP